MSAFTVDDEALFFASSIFNGMRIKAVNVRRTLTKRVVTFIMVTTYQKTRMVPPLDMFYFLN